MTAAAGDALSQRRWRWRLKAAVLDAGHRRFVGALVKSSGHESSSSFCM
jgi:hypothetical protein